MDSKFSLPPLKRYKLYHQQTEKSKNPQKTTLSNQEMETKLSKLGKSSLPPLKRYKLYHQESDNHHQFDQIDDEISNLPAKKRKLSRSSPCSPPSCSVYSLPAKKRIWAINPFDLNVVPNIEEQIPEEKSPKKIESFSQIDQEITAKSCPESEISSQIGEEITGKNCPESEISSQFDEEINEKICPESEFASQIDDEEEKDGIFSRICPEKVELSVENNIGTDEEEEEEDGIVCCVCKSTDGDCEDPIVLCDGCDVMVHCSCYGHPLIKGVPEGDWFCEQCLSKSRIEKKCCLCPVSGGAMKATIDKKWAHIVCALFVPEVFFEDSEGREGIDCGMVPGKRFEGICYLCESKNGCVLDCSEPKCPLSFHVTCGMNEDLYVDYQQGKKQGVVAGFCRKHTDLWQKQQQTGKFKIVAKD